MAKLPTIHRWTEPVDGRMIAGMASAFVARSGYVYGLAVFVLVDLDLDADMLPGWSAAERSQIAHSRAKRTAKDQAEARLRREIVEQHGGRLPPVGYARDLTGLNGVELW